MRRLAAIRRGDTAVDDSGVGAPGQPLLLTIDEAAELLRTTRKAMYAMVERRQLPGVVRIRRRVLFRTAALLDWVDRKSAPLPKE